MKFNSKMMVVFSFVLVLILSACTPEQSVSTESSSLEPGEGEITPNSEPTMTYEPSSTIGLEFTDATGKLVSHSVLLLLAGQHLMCWTPCIYFLKQQKNWWH